MTETDQDYHIYRSRLPHLQDLMDEVDEELAELAELDNLSNKSSACDCPAHVHDREFPLEIAKVGLEEKSI